MAEEPQRTLPVDPPPTTRTFEEARDDEAADRHHGYTELDKISEPSPTSPIPEGSLNEPSTDSEPPVDSFSGEPPNEVEEES